jgi:hypothetical protein
MKRNQYSAYLTAMGAIPFIVCTWCISTRYTNIFNIARIEQCLIIYSSLIACFMAGTHWGQYTSSQCKATKYLPLISNLQVISLWLGYLILQSRLILLIVILNLCISLWADLILYKYELIKNQYFYIRCGVTLVVVTCLILSMIHL